MKVGMLDLQVQLLKQHMHSMHVILPAGGPMLHTAATMTASLKAMHVKTCMPQD